MRWKTILRPSGEKSGYWSMTPRAGRVTCITRVPSGFAVKIAPVVRPASR